MPKPLPIQGLLLDLDGVFYVGGRLIDGAEEALAELRRREIPFRFITNTTTRTPQALLEKLSGFGLEVRAEELFTAVSATVGFLRDKDDPGCFFLVREQIRPELAEFREDPEAPDFVVIGDIGAEWDYAMLNRVFNMLMRGAKLVCMHRNKYWQEEEGLRMDIGAFVAALEYVSGQQALTIGKPSAAFYGGAVRSMGLKPEQVAVVGDDIDSDVGGGQAQGLKGVLVQTGKYREALTRRSPVSPDRTIASIASLPSLLPPR